VLAYKAVQVFLYIFIFYDAKLYADMGLHVIYVGPSIYGWISWRKFGQSQQGIVTRGKGTIVWILMMLIATVVFDTDCELPITETGQEHLKGGA
jgi:nicotinamide mononucleotide transporter